MGEFQNRRPKGPTGFVGVGNLQDSSTDAGRPSRIWTGANFRWANAGLAGGRDPGSSRAISRRPRGERARRCDFVRGRRREGGKKKGGREERRRGGEKKGTAGFPTKRTVAEGNPGTPTGRGLTCKNHWIGEKGNVVQKFRAGGREWIRLNSSWKKRRGRMGTFFRGTFAPKGGMQTSGIAIPPTLRWAKRAIAGS